MNEFELPAIGPDGKFAAYQDAALQKACDETDDYPELNDDFDEENFEND